ncbi:hypothetical protein [Streptomyces sp. NPDC057939]|uniref:hypothetical protein n=1 Tax=Streptomyces sp. NPDC057939 TaxID=3346284 RepID=UPI0036E5ED2A
MESNTTGQTPEPPGGRAGIQTGPRRVVSPPALEAIEEPGLAPGPQVTARVSSTGAHIGRG